MENNINLNQQLKIIYLVIRETVCVVSKGFNPLSQTKYYILTN